jgi:cytochrome c
MNRHYLFAALLATLCASAHAQTSAPPPDAAQVKAAEALAKKNACMGCHATDDKVLGPSYKEVAKRYAGNADALATLTASIKKGGSGKWGAIPMPASDQLRDDEAKQLAAWILSLK